jgi:hypothetical protein
MSFTLIRSVAGLALLAALAAGCGTAAAAHHAAPKPKPAITAPHHAAPKPAATAHHHHSRPMHAAVTTPPAAPATAPAQTANPIPQRNGGDQDADNNGGPSDGDGNI